MSFWRKLNKVMFWLSFCLMEIAVIVVAILQFIAAGESSRYYYSGGGMFVLFGFITLIGGTIVVLTIHSFWGMIVECLDNVAAMKKHMCSSAPSQPAYVQYAAPAQPVYQQPAVPQQQPSTWYCAGCGTTNSGSSTFCQTCGSPRQ